MSMIRAYLLGTGPATVVPGGLHAFVKTRPELAVPDIEFMFRGTSHHPHLWFPLIYPAFRDGFGIRPTLLHPDSRGEVLLRSADPRDPPRIRYNFFTAPNDLPTLRHGFKLAREIAHQPALDPYRERGARSRRRRCRATPRSRPGCARPLITAHHPCRHLRRWARRRTRCSIRRCACAASSGCAWSTLRDARSRLRPHQCLRTDDGREGVRHDPWPCAAAGRHGCMRRGRCLSIKRPRFRRQLIGDGECRSLREGLDDAFVHFGRAGCRVGHRAPAQPA